jgi:hypothetical protein
LGLDRSQTRVWRPRIELSNYRPHEERERSGSAEALFVGIIFPPTTWANTTMPDAMVNATGYSSTSGTPVAEPTAESPQVRLTSR